MTTLFKAAPLWELWGDQCTNLIATAGSLTEMLKHPLISSLREEGPRFNVSVWHCQSGAEIKLICAVPQPEGHSRQYTIKENLNGRAHEVFRPEAGGDGSVRQGESSRDEGVRSTDHVHRSGVGLGTGGMGSGGSSGGGAGGSPKIDPLTIQDPRVLSLPLPKDHWAYDRKDAEVLQSYGPLRDLPRRTLEDERANLKLAFLQAMRDMTGFGTIKDPDPDAGWQAFSRAWFGSPVSLSSSTRPPPLYRDLTPEELASPEFDLIWKILKPLDIAVPEWYQGSTGAMGEHAAAILRSVRRGYTLELPDMPLSDHWRKEKIRNNPKELLPLTRTIWWVIKDWQIKGVGSAGLCDLGWYLAMTLFQFARNGAAAPSFQAPPGTPEASLLSPSPSPEPKASQRGSQQAWQWHVDRDRSLINQEGELYALVSGDNCAEKVQFIVKALNARDQALKLIRQYFEGKETGAETLIRVQETLGYNRSGPRKREGDDHPQR